MDNLIGTIMPTGTLIGGYLAMGGGGSSDDRFVEINFDQETMQLDKTAGEINDLVNSGKIVLLMGRQLFIEEYDDTTDTLIASFYIVSFISRFTIVGNQVTNIDKVDYAMDNNYVHTDNNFTTTYKTKLDNIPEIIDLSSYQVGDTITDTTIIAKLMNDGSKIKYGDTIYTYARLDLGIVRLYTVMADVDHGEYIALIVQQNDLLFYEKQNAYWELPSNKVTSLSASSTDTEYPSAKCVYDLVGDIESLLNNINSGGGV